MVMLAEEQESGNFCPRDGVWIVQGPMSARTGTQGTGGSFGK